MKRKRDEISWTVAAEVRGGHLHRDPQGFTVEQRQDMDVKSTPGVIGGYVDVHILHALRQVGGRGGSVCEGYRV